MTGLPFGPLDTKTVFVCIDMQRLFLEPGEWYCESGLKILPTVERLAEVASSNCVFTRFVTACVADEAVGRWRQYYQRWHSVTRSEAGEPAMDLHQSLSPYASDDRRFDKTVYNAFCSSAFSKWILKMKPSALVLFGIETDVCVLATALSAVDLGIRVIIIVDAVASADAASHDACLSFVYTRFDQQIELSHSSDVIDAWNVAMEASN